MRGSALILVLWLGSTPVLRAADEPDTSLHPAAAEPSLAEQESAAEAEPGGWKPVDAESWAWYPQRPRRYVQADVLFWDRVGTGCDQPLVNQASDDPFVFDANTVLSTGDLDFDYEPGVRLTIGWFADPCRGCNWCTAWELTYFGIFDWDATATVIGDNDLEIPGTLAFFGNNFFGGDEMRAVYDSQLHNIELNCVKSCCFDYCTHGKGKGGSGAKDECDLCCRTRLDFLCGFRFLTLQEDFSLIATDGQASTSSYDISTENYLYGVQVGGRLRHQLPRWIVEVRGTAGVFVNDAQQRQTVYDFNPNLLGPDPVPLQGRDGTRGSGQSPAMLGEIGVSLIRPITSVWSLRVGYEALGLGGLALAPDQLDFTYLPGVSGTGLHDTGWIFLHGVHLGLEAYW